MEVGQLVWVNLRGAKGAGRITKQDTDGVTVHYLESGRDDITVPRKNIEVMDEPKHEDERHEFALSIAASGISNADFHAALAEFDRERGT